MEADRAAKGAPMRMHELLEHLGKLWARVLEAPPGLIFLGGMVIGGLLVTVVTWREMPPLVGVLVGAIISGAFASIIALEARRIQLAATTWAKRLQAHQEAFSLWHQCWSVVHEQDKDRKYQTLKKAEDWWFDNCLYLSEPARNRFKRMTMSVDMHGAILDIKRNTPKEREKWEKEINDNWNFIQDTGQTIVQGSGSQISDEVIKRMQLGPVLDPYGRRVEQKPAN
jgi:hypothetical protein